MCTVNHDDNEYEQPEGFFQNVVVVVVVSGLIVNSRNSLSFSDMTKYQLDKYANELFQETPWKY